MSPPVDRSRAVVRPMRRTEAPLVGELTLASYDAHGSLQGPYRDYLRDPLIRLEGSTALYVAELDGRVVGTVTAVEPGDREWEGRPELDGDTGFRVLAVAPGVEGRGVGRALVETCLTAARLAGRRRVFLTSMDWMTRAHRLYERSGFVRRRDLDVRFPAGIGLAFTCDLVPDADAYFPPPGPIPAEPPRYQQVWSAG
jgi:GNAT superfamily N-acetyltransferase